MAVNESPWPPPADDLPDAPMLGGDSRAEVAIVGGGFAGLSAAYHLLREQPGRDVVLIEAKTVGAGASGVNTGMLGPGVGGTIVAMRRRYGAEMAARMFQTTFDAVELVIQLVEREGLRCDLEVTSQLKVGLTERQDQSLRNQAREFERLGMDVPYVDAEGVARAIGTRAYRGAIRYKRAANLNPLRLCRELRRALIGKGVRIHEWTPVRRVRPGTPIRLELDRGSVSAEKVVIATNGYTPTLGLLRGRVFPIQTHVILTEPLGASERAALGWQGREGIIDSRNFFNYYHLTADDRLVFGGGKVLYRAADGDRWAGATEGEEPASWRRLERELIDLFPVLAETKVVRRWSGTMGLTLDNLPVVGTPADAPGVLFVGAWCGHGVALATASGVMTADLLAGRTTDRIAVPWVRASAPRMPPDPLRQVGFAAYIQALDIADKLGAVAERVKNKFGARVSADAGGPVPDSFRAPGMREGRKR